MKFMASAVHTVPLLLVGFETFSTEKKKILDLEKPGKLKNVKTNKYLFVLTLFQFSRFLKVPVRVT